MKPKLGITREQLLTLLGEPDAYRWLKLRYASERVDSHIEHLEHQHDLAQDAVAAADRGDTEGTALALEKLRETFDEERKR
jgi:hypothetical protein